MDYQAGIQKLLQHLGPDSPYQAEVLVLQARLVENLNKERIFGSTETRRSERSEVIYALNNIALITLGVSFNDFILEVKISPQQEELSRMNELETRLRSAFSKLQQNNSMLRSAKNSYERERILQLITNITAAIKSEYSEYITLSKKLNINTNNDITQNASAIQAANYQISAHSDLVNMLIEYWRGAPAQDPLVRTRCRQLAQRVLERLPPAATAAPSRPEQHSEAIHAALATLRANDPVARGIMDQLAQSPPPLEGYA